MPDDVSDQGDGVSFRVSERLEDDVPFRLLLETVPAGAYICDAEGLITYFNRQAVELWGRAPKLHDPIDRFCGSFKLYSTDGSAISHDQCWMAKALQTGSAFIGEEIVVERPDGRRMTVLAHANPIRNKSGGLVGAVNMLVDITDRKRAEEANALLASIIESSDDAIVSKTLDGTILSWNAGAEKLFGYTEEEAIGASILLIIPPELRDEEQTILARLRRGERIDHFETIRMTKDGRRVDVSVSVSPVRDRTGRIIAAAKVARDITARKQSDAALVILNDRLREADRRKDEFLATLAHELRNPLAPLSNSLQILRMSEDQSPAAAKMHEIMDRQVKQLTRLVDDLLEVSRIARGKIELRKEPVELAAVVASAVETSRPLIDAAGHQFAISLPPEPITLLADSVRISQVISNLLNNAAKYTKEGGQVWLTVRHEGNQAVISVRDSGLGIPPDVLPYVFEMFTQADRTIGRAQGGLGIGLTLAKSFVQMHEGRIEARSAGPDRGSEFVIHLPIPEPQNVRTPVQTAPPRPQWKVLPIRRILVVDDTRAAVFTLGKLLEKMGQHVTTLQDPAAALDTARRERPDLVLSDIAMPNIDGYELARQLRAQPGLENVVLVAITGYGQDSDRQRAREAGFNHHLVKPVSLDALQELLASLPQPANRVLA